MILPNTPLMRRLDKRQICRPAIVSAVVDALEARMMLTGTLTPIATFNGVDGYAQTPPLRMPTATSSAPPWPPHPTTATRSARE